MVSSDAMVSIPDSTRKMIQNIKETTAGNYSEDDAMLHEYNIDPDETVQRLFLQGPFQEVKKKRDKRKENTSNKISTKSLLRSGGVGRGSMSTRMSFSSRYASHDVAGAKNSFRKENGLKQVTDPSNSSSQDVKQKYIALVSSHLAELDKSIVGLTMGSSDVPHSSNIPASSVGSKDVPTEQKLVDSLPLHCPSSPEVRFISSNPKLGQTELEKMLEKSSSMPDSMQLGVLPQMLRMFQGLLHHIATVLLVCLLLATVIAHIRMSVLGECWLH